MTRRSLWALKISKKFIPSPRYEVLKFWCRFVALLGKFYTFFDHCHGIAICRPQKCWIGPNFFLPESWWQGLDFKIFGFGLSKPSASLFSTFRKNIGFVGFASLQEKNLTFTFKPPCACGAGWCYNPITANICKHWIWFCFLCLQTKYVGSFQNLYISIKILKYVYIACIT